MIGKSARIAVAIGLASLFGMGCSTGQGKPDETSDETTTSETAKSAAYGADPMGVARKWAASPPDELPESVRSTVASWEEPIVVRLYRHRSDQYRAVVAGADKKEGPAVRLTIVEAENASEKWRVDEVAETTADELWPTM